MRLMQKLFGKKLNNKGNTLGVVVIGILLLGILGTLILNITAANYQMKLVDNQSKRNFYYVEKAVDEIYAGIGVEAMGAVSEAYQYVLTNMVSRNVDDNSKFDKLSNEEANAEFGRQYFLNLSYKYIKDKETDIEFPIENTLEVLKEYIGSVNNITFDVEKLDTTEVVYEESQNELRFKDIKVSSRTASGFYASVTTDFIVTLPDVDLGLADTGSNNLDELYKFALVVDGYETLQKKVDNNTEDFDSLLHITKQRLNDRNTASMTISSGWDGSDTNVIGNIYVGTNSVSKKNSVDIKSNAKLNIYAENFISGGSIVLQNAIANFNGIDPEHIDIGDGDIVNYGLMEENQSKVGLRLWANNLSTDEVKDNNTGVGTSNELTVNGDCIIADDLEINGDNSKVRINGSYFGYGYSSSLSDKAVEANSSEITIFDTDDAPLGADYMYEHEKRSAIIINGKNADVILEPATGNDIVILGGRAYIDLETGSITTGNATYMTGESVSFKGNQNIYKAGTEDLGTVIRSNPVAYDSIRAYISGDGLDYAALGIDPEKVIAKRVNNNVYFYKYNNDPVNQTDYFLQQVNNSFIVRDAIESQIESLGVENLMLGVAGNQYKNIYSVGAITQVQGGNLLNYQSVKGVSGGKLETDFLGLIEEMEYRYSFISSELEDFDGVAYGDLSDMSETAKDTTVYSNFVDEKTLVEILEKYKEDGGGDRYEEQNIEEKYVPSDIAEEFCESVFGKSVYEINLGVTMMDNAHTGGDVLATERDYGVIVATGDVIITKDFTGIILCGGNLTISNGATVTACPKLIELLATYDPMLSQLFEVTYGDTDGESVIDISNTDYQKLISLENWRKN